MREWPALVIAPRRGVSPELRSPHNRGAGPGPQDGGKALRLGPDAPLDDLVALGEDADLAFPLVHVDANMAHGWPLLTAALTAMALVGSICHHGKREASRFVPSMLKIS